jgi:hypothetical protein
MADLSELIENKDELKIIQWLQMNQVLHNSRKCHRCENWMVLQKRNELVNDSYGWRCTKCSTRKSIRADTFLQTTNISLTDFMRIVLHWALQTRQIDQVGLVERSRQTIITIQQKLRAVCVQAFDKDNIRLGGSNKVVEIDESLFVRVKHGKGKDLKRSQVWVFGMVEREDEERCLFFVVPKPLQ